LHFAKARWGYKGNPTSKCSLTTAGVQRRHKPPGSLRVSFSEISLKTVSLHSRCRSCTQFVLKLVEAMWSSTTWRAHHVIGGQRLHILEPVTCGVCTHTKQPAAAAPPAGFSKARRQHDHLAVRSNCWQPRLKLGVDQPSPAY
jgi:hypothetical protein